MVLAQLECIYFSITSASFHPTMVLAQRGDLHEQRDSQERFHPTMVLAQPCGEDGLSGSHSVSIPLWFSLNKFIAGDSKYKMFPSHYGSRST